MLYLFVLRSYRETQLLIPVMTLCSPIRRHCPIFVLKDKLKIPYSLTLVVSKVLGHQFYTNFLHSHVFPIPQSLLIFSHFAIISTVTCLSFSTRIITLATFYSNFNIVGRSAQPSNTTSSPFRRKFVPFENMCSQYDLLSTDSF
jgi:hypothetical protein